MAEPTAISSSKDRLRDITSAIAASSLGLSWRSRDSRSIAQDGATAWQRSKRRVRPKSRTSPPDPISRASLKPSPKPSAAEPEALDSTKPCLWAQIIAGWSARSLSPASLACFETSRTNTTPLRTSIAGRIHFLPAPVTGTACISLGSRLSMTVSVAGYFIASVGANSTLATQLPAFIPFALGSRVSTH